MSKRIWLITGAKGCGKSTAACRFARPSEIGKMVVFDTEDSLSDIIEDNKRLGVNFGAYIRAYDRFKMTDDMLELVARGKLPWVTEGKKSQFVEYWNWFVETLNNTIDKDKHEYLVIDTIEPIEAAATAWAEMNKQLSGWTGKNAYGCLEVEGVRPLLDGTFEAIHKRGIKHIILTSHTKNPWVEYAPGKSKPVLDKVIPGGRLKLWSKLSTAMLWMERPARPVNAEGAPSAIVLKARAGRSSVDNQADEWNTKSLIPPRIPKFTWREWRNYLENGWNPLHPKEGEMLYPDEERLISEFLSNEEYKLMVLGAQIALEEEKNEQSGVFIPSGQSFSLQSAKNTESSKGSTETIVARMLSEGKTEIEIAEAVKKPVPLVKAIIKRMTQ